MSAALPARPLLAGPEPPAPPGPAAPSLPGGPAPAPPAAPGTSSGTMAPASPGAARPAPAKHTFQLPAGFQLPPGTVLIRSSNGQLMLVSQQALARAQAQVQSNQIQRPPVPTSTPAVRLCTVQNSGAPLQTNVSSPSPTLKTLPACSVSSTVENMSVTQSATVNVNIASAPDGVLPAAVLATSGSTATVGTHAAPGTPMTVGKSVPLRTTANLTTHAATLTSLTVGTTAITRTPMSGIPNATLMSVTSLPTTAVTPLTVAKPGVNRTPVPPGITQPPGTPGVPRPLVGPGTPGVPRPLVGPGTPGAISTSGTFGTSSGFGTPTMTNSMPPNTRMSITIGAPAAVGVPVTVGMPTTVSIPSSVGMPVINRTSVTNGTSATAGTPLTVGMPATVRVPSTFGMSAGTRMSVTFGNPPTSAAPVTVGIPGTIRTPVTVGSTAALSIPSTTLNPATAGMPASICLPVSIGMPSATLLPASTPVTVGMSGPTRISLTGTPAVAGTPVTGSLPTANMNPTTGAATASCMTPKMISIKADAPKVTPAAQSANSTEMLDNVKKCKNFLGTLIKLASSGPQAPEMGQNVKNLVQNLLDAKIEPEEFTKRLYTELKSSPQPYLVPFLKKSLPALRQIMPNSQNFIQQCVQQQPTAVTKINPTAIATTTVSQPVTVRGNAPVMIKLQQPASILRQQTSTPQAVTVKQLIVQQPSGGVLKQVSTLPQTTTQIAQKPGERKVPVNMQIQPRPFAPASILKQITLPGNKILSFQASPVHKTSIKENGIASFRDEDDINDVTSMAGVNLNEEHARILATNSELVGRLIRSSKEEPFLSAGPLQKKILDIGKKHDVLELNSDAVSLISYATQERLRGLVEKLTVAAQHRAATYKGSDKYILSNDTKSQLKFLEQLDHLEKQRKNEEEREMLLRAAKSRSNKEDPEQLRLKQKAKEMQQMELAQMQQRQANLAALAAIGPRRKRPLESSRFEGSNSSTLSTSSATVGLGKQLLRPRTTRVCLRDLIFCMEQEREMKHSLALYRAHLK